MGIADEILQVASKQISEIMRRGCDTASQLGTAMERMGEAFKSPRSDFDRISSVRSEIHAAAKGLQPFDRRDFPRDFEELAAIQDQIARMHDAMEAAIPFGDVIAQYHSQVPPDAPQRLPFADEQFRDNAQLVVVLANLLQRIIQQSHLDRDNPELS